jgi:hypothetical protein
MYSCLATENTSFALFLHSFTIYLM